jgi:hypothetical protein
VLTVARGGVVHARHGESYATRTIKGWEAAGPEHEAWLDESSAVPHGVCALDRDALAVELDHMRFPRVSRSWDCQQRPGLPPHAGPPGKVAVPQLNDSWKLAGDVHQDPVHFVQMWVVPDEDNITPGYEQLEIDHELLSGGLVPVASGMDKHDGASAIRIKNKYAALYAARLQPGQSVELPEAPFLHLFVPRGSVTLEGAGPLATGDAVRFTATGGQKVTATEQAEILVWEMHAALAA